MVDVELDTGIGSEVRRLIRNASYERGFRSLGEEEEDRDEWRFSIDELSDQVLFDHDFGDGDVFLDTPPGEDSLRKQMGIDDRYFVAVPRDVRDADIALAFDRIRQLVR